MDYNTLYNMLPLGKEGQMVLGLDTMERLMKILDHPEEKVKIIHIAGTNGKGSTASFLRSILSEAGYKVGLFTSPSLVEFNERIRIGGRDISDKQLMEAAQTIKNRVEQIEPELTFTEFELFTALAYLMFAKENCDFAIMEVGLGGRLDATNIVKQPILTLITKIALDHQAILGESLKEIAREKAGILKKGVPLVLYPQDDPSVNQAILSQAQNLDVLVHQLNPCDYQYHLNQEPGVQQFKFKEQAYQINLLEEHQIKNASLAILGAQVLNGLNYPIDLASIQTGLAKTKWPARFELLQETPPIIIDGSHNVDGLIELKKNLMRYYPEKEKIAILGMLADKDVDGALEIVLPLFDKVITVTPPNDRGMKAAELKEKIQGLKILATGAVVDSATLEEAYHKGVKLAQNQRGILTIFGSTYYVGLMRHIILG